MSKTVTLYGIEMPMEEALELMEEEEANRKKVKEKLKKEQTKKQNSIKVEDLTKEEHYEHSS